MAVKWPWIPAFEEMISASDADTNDCHMCETTEKILAQSDSTYSYCDCPVTRTYVGSIANIEGLIGYC